MCIRDRGNRGLTTYDLLIEDANLSDVIRPTNVPGLSLCPATTDLSSADIELVSNEKRSFLLHDALRQPAIDKYGFDYVPVSYTHLDVYKRQPQGPGRTGAAHPG